MKQDRSVLRGLDLGIFLLIISFERQKTFIKNDTILDIFNS